MRRAFIPTVILIFAGLLPLAAQQSKKLVAPTPPMGWNSWDCFGLTVDEKDFRANAEWLAKHLKSSGWQYVVVDEGWFLPHPEVGPKPGREVVLDSDSRYIPATNRYPSAEGDKGFKPLADYVHSLGLKFGLHIVRGIPREAVAKNQPIAGSSFRAADVADTSDTCPWDHDNFGVRDNAAGQAFYDSVARLYAGWGVDFVKVDCISSHPYKGAEIRMLSNAIAKSGRPMVLSLSPGPTSVAVAEEVVKYSQMWRISDDFWDYWTTSPRDSWTQTLHGQIATAAAWAPYIGNGHWPDADMLPIGYLGPHPGLGEARQTRFTHDEQRTLITFWSIIRSPLIIGGNLPRSDEWTTALLTNPEVLAVNQHSKNNRPVLTTNSLVVWTAAPEDGKGLYVAVVNRGDGKLGVNLGWDEVGLEAGQSYNVRDLWEHKDLGVANGFKAELPPHASALLRISK
ncbi:MAG: glycoside hydrolase family 27 protein [Deltaproteobacteria bacterium]